MVLVLTVRVVEVENFVHPENAVLDAVLCVGNCGVGLVSRPPLQLFCTQGNVAASATLDVDKVDANVSAISKIKRGKLFLFRLVKYRSLIKFFIGVFEILETEESESNIYRMICLLYTSPSPRD